MSLLSFLVLSLLGTVARAQDSPASSSAQSTPGLLRQFRDALDSLPTLYSPPSTGKGDSTLSQAANGTEAVTSALQDLLKPSSKDGVKYLGDPGLGTQLAVNTSDGKASFLVRNPTNYSMQQAASFTPDKGITLRDPQGTSAPGSLPTLQINQQGLAVNNETLLTFPNRGGNAPPSSPGADGTAQALIKPYLRLMNTTVVGSGSGDVLGVDPSKFDAGYDQSYRVQALGNDTTKEPFIQQLAGGSQALSGALPPVGQVSAAGFSSPATPPTVAAVLNNQLPARFNAFATTNRPPSAFVQATSAASPVGSPTGFAAASPSVSASASQLPPYVYTPVTPQVDPPRAPQGSKAASGPSTAWQQQQSWGAASPQVAMTQQSPSANPKASPSAAAWQQQQKQASSFQAAAQKVASPPGAPQAPQSYYAGVQSQPQYPVLTPYQAPATAQNWGNNPSVGATGRKLLGSR